MTASSLTLKGKHVMITPNSGGQKDIENLLNEIENDPQKHMRLTSDPNHLLNRPNQSGKTPLYVAAQHGHL